MIGRSTVVSVLVGAVLASACTSGGSVVPSPDREAGPKPSNRLAAGAVPQTVRIQLDGPRRGPKARLRSGAESIAGVPESYTWLTGGGSFRIVETGLARSRTARRVEVPAGALLHVDGRAVEISAALGVGTRRPFRHVADLDMAGGLGWLPGQGGRFMLSVEATFDRGQVRFWFPIDVVAPNGATVGPVAPSLFVGDATFLPLAQRENFRSEPAPRHLTWFWPRSGAARPGVVYGFEVGHCGLLFLTDFGGTFWHPVSPAPDREPPSFFYNADRGKIVQLSNDWAAYESSTGSTVLLVRHDGAFPEYFCA